MAPQIPSYRLQKSRNLAVVTLGGKDFYLGKFGSPESREKYHRLVAEYLASRRDEMPPPSPDDPPPTVAGLILAYWTHCRAHYRRPDGKLSEECGNVKVALRPLRKLYGATLARDFGPLALRAVRDEMVRQGLARTSVNARVGRVRRAFRWAASVELVAESVVRSLDAVDGLRAGRTAARETAPVGPVPLDQVEATLPLLTRPVAGLVRLQLLTGMRPGEACSIRGRDLAPGPDGVWTYRPAAHKTAWRGKAREIALGPRAVELVREFLKPDLDAYLFDPRDAVADQVASRGQARKSRPTPSERARRKAEPGACHARKYSRASYRNAIRSGCRRAGIPGWSPNQLRHAAATLVRARFGLEAAQVVLGHARADVTQVYAEKNLSLARDVMREIG